MYALGLRRRYDFHKAYSLLVIRKSTKSDLEVHAYNANTGMLRWRITTSRPAWAT
jgi:hypothetical protein